MRRALVPLVSAALVAAPLVAGSAATAGAESAAHPGLAARPGLPARPGLAARPAAALPRVGGSFGTTPSISFPNAKPPTTLVHQVLHQGHGSTVRKGDLLAVNYTGQIWRGKVFDSSFLSKFGHQTPFGTPIGLGKVVPGWDDGLVGARVGDRVLLVIPPKWGYGSKGQAQAGIKGTDTLVFVVDILGAWGPNAHSGSGSASYSHNGVSVTGHLSSAPKVTISKSAAKPKAVVTDVLSRGHGTKINKGLVVYEEYVTNWSGRTVASTWGQQPTSSSVGTASAGFDPFANVPVGSRVLFEEPASSQGGPYAVVVDLVALVH